MKPSRKPIFTMLTLFNVALFSLALVAPLRAQTASLPLFGPEKFSREAGTPDIVSRAFAACNTGATYRLVVENGATSKDRVSSATIALNGVEIVRPGDLNQRVERIEKEVVLQGENTLAVRLASNPGGFLTVSLFCTSGCLDVIITSPSPSSTVNKAKALVQGSLLNASGETGVVLTAAGSEGDSAGLAQVQGNLFAGLVPLQTGENTLTAVATDACGYKTEESAKIYVDSLQQSVELTVTPASGVLSSTSGIFEVVLEAQTSIPSVNFSWDFDGNGTEDQAGQDLSRVTTQYSAPGLYFPTVSAIDSQGNRYVETAAVNVVSKEKIDALLQTKWEGMKEQLTAGAVEKAIPFFAERSRSSYRQQFTLLSQHLPQIMAEMGATTLIKVEGDRAIYDLRTVRNGKTYSFQLEFIRDGDGIWRIKNF